MHTPDVRLTLEWPAPPDCGQLRWTVEDFQTFRALASAPGAASAPLELNAFQAFRIFRAKNFDLFLTLDLQPVAKQLEAVDDFMRQLESFERQGRPPQAAHLAETYLALRQAAARPTASEERRALWLLLFSGPSTAKQLARELGRSENLAERLLRALSAVAVHDEAAATWRLGHGHLQLVQLAAALMILRSTLGTDPLPPMLEAARRRHA